ncbi:hypothetical protein [Nocardia cyriacigeorgica]|uniref:hypothetical protein n=1 Tax=Nocardia cyriacigeorgica TaxID=135487 RepID=UPI00189454A0|nr:hypothetical protein [Nocardia cyriacigeorgica]MBF6416935.1 hypothetical protein [Nocardia cyriacigeorgica]
MTTHSPLWWLSFVDPDKSRPRHQQVPGAGGFLGACIVGAPTFLQAVDRARELGCNPGGEVKAIPTGPPPHRAWMNRLLTAVDIDQIDAIEAGLDAPKTAELLGRGLWARTVLPTAPEVGR